MLCLTGSIRKQKHPLWQEQQVTHVLLLQGCCLKEALTEKEYALLNLLVKKMAALKKFFLI